MRILPANETGNAAGPVIEIASDAEAEAAATSGIERNETAAGATAITRRDLRSNPSWNPPKGTTRRITTPTEPRTKTREERSTTKTALITAVTMVISIASMRGRKMKTAAVSITIGTTAVITRSRSRTR